MYSLIIVDDEFITGAAVKGYIEKKHKDFHVDGIFSNGYDALNYTSEHMVNIIITDIVMPGMDGLSLAKHVSQKCPGVIVIILSGYNEFTYAQKAIQYGVSSYLLKPLDFLELSQVLKEAKEKLDAIYSTIDYSEEDIQLFFTDLIMGSLNSKSCIEERFSNLSLSGKFPDYKGCVVMISLEENDFLKHWKYGLESLEKVLLNCIDLSSAEYKCYYLFRCKYRYYYILLSEHGIPDFNIELLENQLHQVLNLTCKIHLKSIFHNILELSASSTLKKEVTLAIPSKDVSTNLVIEDKVIQNALSYINIHYAKDITRDDVAGAVFLSSAYFSRIFKQKVGLSFSDYLTNVRMQKAIELLNTNMKVIDIAQKVGYQSRNRFFINFRQYSGYTPTEYRRNILRREEYEDTEDQTNEF